MKPAKEWRQEGLLVFFTVNTGQDIHIICQKKNEEKILKKIKALPRIRVISNSTSQGTYLVDKHLF